MVMKLLHLLPARPGKAQPARQGLLFRHQHLSLAVPSLLGLFLSLVPDSTCRFPDSLPHPPARQERQVLPICMQASHWLDELSIPAASLG